MFRLDADLKVYLHRGAVDFRKSINGLSVLMEQSMKRDPLARAVYAGSETGALIASNCCCMSATDFLISYLFPEAPFFRELSISANFPETVVQ